MWHELRIALAFLTILPVQVPAGLEGRALARSAAFFPLAGWVLGILFLLAARLFAALFGPGLVAALLLVALLAWLTRGLHLDGLADLLDGLGGSHEPARRLAIMKDSGIGAFGVIGLILLLLVKASTLAALLPVLLQEGNLPLLAPLVGARWAMVTLAWRTSYPRPAGTGHPFVGRITGRELGIGALFLLPLFMGDGSGLLAALAALLPALWLRYKTRSALGGVTGDVLGASCELGETVGWLVLLALQGV